MRIAIVSDIHDNFTALEAVLADLKDTSPDLILHGGDLTGSGSKPAEAIDCIRALGWSGVCGNTDEMLFRPESLAENVPGIPEIQAMADWTRDRLGHSRIAWLRELPRVVKTEALALVHASPESLWRAPADEGAFAVLERPMVVYGHIHKPFVHESVANSGSVGLSYDGDPRASYLLIDGSSAIVRRVEYDLDRELKNLAECGMPHSAWVAEMLTKAAPTPPARR
jgi:predicted phosphodiesterase